MNTLQLHNSPGWFGKLPCAGDFSSSNIPQQHVDLIDQWLSGIMHAGLANHGERWMQAYFDARIHGFAWAPGASDAIGEKAAIGILMPSIDSAGRAYPFLLLQILTPTEWALLTQQALQPWMQAAQQACTLALEQDWPFSVLNTALSALPPLPFLKTSQNPTGNMPSIGQSHWFDLAYNGQMGQPICCEGLPGLGSFEKMLGFMQPNDQNSDQNNQAVGASAARSIP